MDASRGRSHAAGGDADFEARVSELYKSKKGLSPSDGALSGPPTPPHQAPPETGSETYQCQRNVTLTFVLAVSAADELASDYLRKRVAGLDALMQGAWGR